MAVHLRPTIEVPFPTQTATLALATRLDFAAVTVYVPETTSRTFRSVQVEVTVRGAETAATSLTSWMIGIKLGATAFNDVTQTLTLTNSGDQQSFTFTRDVTSYFNANFGAGTSQTCQVGVQFGALATQNITVKLLITYEAEDSTTRIRTYRTLLDSSTAVLTATLAEIGTSQIPNLDNELPEASKVIRHAWFELIFNEASAAVTDFNLEVRLDAEAATTAAICEQALNTSCYGKVIWVKSFTTNATHQFHARSTLASRFHLAVVLCVTYEYNHDTSTTMMNSVVLPLGHDPVRPGITTSADKSRSRTCLWIEEPGPITMKQSGILAKITVGNAISLSIQAGAQAAARATTVQQATAAGPIPVGHRVDSGGAQGAAYTLARGKNLLDLDWFVNSNSNGFAFNAVLYLNYTSSKHASGDGVHNKSTLWTLLDMDNTAAATQRQFTPTAPNIVESQWAWNGAVVEAFVPFSATQALAVEAEAASGEHAGAGWVNLASTAWTSGAGENSIVPVSLSVTHSAFDRWSTEHEERLDPEASRAWRIAAVASVTFGARLWVTMHNIAYTIADSVSGFGAGTVTITAMRDSDKTKVGSTTRTGNGAFSITVFDNTTNGYFVEATDGTNVGRSALATPA